MAGARKKLRWQELTGLEGQEDDHGKTRRQARSSGDHPPLAVLTKEPSPMRSSRGHNQSQKSSARGGRSSPSARRIPKAASQHSRTVVESAHVLVERLNAWEKQLKTSRSGEQDRAGCSSACSALRSTSVQMINAYPGTAKTLRISERLWMNWYREMDELQTQTRRSPNQRPARHELAGVFTACSKFYSELVQQLQALVRRPRLTPEHREGVQHSLQLALVALGDVARYAQNQLEKQEPRDWMLAKQHYLDALHVAPSNGKVYNQLGLLAMLEGKALEGAYVYARSLACEHPFAARDNFLHALRRGKFLGTQQQQQCMDVPVCQATKMFSSLVLSCQYFLLKGEECDAVWSAELERMKAALRHLLNVFDSQTKEESPDDSSESLTEILSAALTQAVCITIVLAHDAQHSIGETSTRQDFERAFVGWRINAATTKALELGSVIVQYMLAKLVAVLSELAESAEAKRLANALLPAVNVYLGWMHAHPALLDGLHPSAGAFQAQCAGMFNTLSARGFVERGLCCSSKRGDLSVVALPEDRELQGFLPCESSFQQRAQQENAHDENSTRPLTSEEFMVLRAVRFMKRSECFVLPTHSIAPSSRTFPASRHHANLVKEVGPAVDLFAVEPMHRGRLCALCSNTSTFSDGVCEFCGYEDECEDGVLLDNGLGTAQQAAEPSWVWSEAITASKTPSPETVLSPESKSPHARRAAVPSSPLLEAKSPTAVLESDFSVIMGIGAEHAGFQGGLDADAEHERLIIVDAPNVAMRHGKGKLFSCIGIQLAASYFQALGHRVVAFIPDYMLQSGDERAQRQEHGAVLTAAKIPDDVALLEKLVQDGLLIPTPPQDYDDSYCIQYAGLHDGFVVTNDLFRDHVANMVGPRERKEAMRAWLRAHQISYSWVRNEFLPNPNFRFPEASQSKF